MPYRILHLADVHLDMAFLGLESAQGNRRREQLRAAFERALQLARERSVDAVCIAGDLYEDRRAGADRAKYLQRVLKELAPIRVFLAPGNHDPVTESSVYRQMAPLPDNVFLFDRRAFARVKLTDRIALWGFGHEYAADRNPAFSDFACDGPGTHLLLFHGSDRSRMPPGKESVAPFVPADIEAAGAAYAMIGHFHGMLEGVRYAYPGSLEPHGFADDGRHTASIVTVGEDGAVTCEFIEMDRVRYRTFDFDLSPFGDRVELQRALETQLGESTAASGSPICRVRLLGSAQPSLDLNLEAMEVSLGGEYPGLELVEKFEAFDFDAILRRGRTVQSEFIKDMRAQIDAAPDDEKPVLERALTYGMLAFAGKEIPR